MAIPATSSPTTADARVPGVILAIDYGQKRLGLALSDEFGVTSRPYATWTRTNRRRDLARLRELVRQQGVRRILVGLPLDLRGTRSEMSDEAAAFATRVRRYLGVPVEMVDERLSSWEAYQTISTLNLKRRARRGASGGAGEKTTPPVDEVAAAIILRDYLDHLRPRTGRRT